MATRKFFVNDGLKVKGDTFLNGSTYTDGASAKLHVKTAANGTGANLNNVNGLLIENSGTGNTNYGIKLASGSGNIFNVSNAGNVGIGVTTATSILHIVGPASAPTSLGEFDTASTIQLQSDSSNTDSLYIAEASSGAQIQVTDGASNSSTAKPLLINPYGGNVGIGTAALSAKLHVVNTAEGNVHYESAADLIVEDTEARVQIVGDDGGTNASALILSNAPATGDNKHWFIHHGGVSASNNFEIGYLTSSSTGFDALVGTPDLVIDTSGKVGIGTTSPASPLQVQADGIGIRLDGTANTTRSIFFRNTTDANPAQIYSDGSLKLFTDDANTDIYLMPVAHVGIGTTNPGYLLDVNGTANIGGALTVSGLTSLATNGSGYALKISENSGGEYFQLGVNSYGGLEFYNETTKVAEFYDTGDFKIPDSLKILMGTGDDLQIYHTGSESWIADTGSGDLNLSTNGNRIKLWKGIGTEALANFEANGAVSLYYDNAVKLATTATGVDITGQLSATTKSFLIDHPTKPGKKLRHGSLEGPENGVYIRGKSDSNIIELPEYWTELVDEDSITVQLTPIGKHQHIYVESIKNNVIHIQSDEARKNTNNLEYYYLILAERKDVDKLVIEE